MRLNTLSHHKHSQQDSSFSVENGIPRAKRAHTWSASSTVLAVMTTLLLLNGCNNKQPSEQPAAQAEQAIKEQVIKEEAAPASKDDASNPPEIGRTLDETRGKESEKMPPAGETPQKQ